MQKFFLTAPLWLLAVASGVPAGIVLVLLFYFAEGDSWPVAAGFAAGGAVLVGGVVVVARRRQRGMLRSAVGTLPDEKAVAALRAAATGPVPGDDEVRVAALAVARRQLAEIHRPVTRYALLLAMGIGLATTVLNVLSDERFSLGPVLLVLLGLWLLLIWPRQLRRRIELLSGGQGSDS